MQNKGLFITVIITAFILLAGILMYFTYDNKYITLRNLYDAQVSEDKIVYDEVWKVISQQAQVGKQYEEGFRKIYVDLMDARNYGGESFKWIQEQNPTFSQDMYKQLMTTIESQRAKFRIVQSKLITYHQEIKNLTQLFPSRLFVGGREVPELKLVTSSKTEATFDTGKEDDIDLFKKDSAK